MARKKTFQWEVQKAVMEHEEEEAERTAADMDAYFEDCLMMMELKKERRREREVWRMKKAEVDYLSLIGTYLGIKRRWYEIPFILDCLYRKRLTDFLKSWPQC